MKLFTLFVFLSLLVTSGAFLGDIINGAGNFLNCLFNPRGCRPAPPPPKPDPCSPNPCQNNGICRSQSNGFSCSCSYAFKGDRCEIRDSCSPNPCKNNGICRSQSNGYSCSCSDEFKGDQCEIKADSCTCTASGDPHYRTFDGQMIHFYGACKYTIASYRGLQCTFDVEGKHEYRGGNKAVSYMRLIDFKYKGHVYRLHQGRNLYVDGAQKYLPYQNEDVIVQTTGNKIILEGPCGVTVEFDGQHSFELHVPQNIGKGISGMCGTCNNIADDLKTKDGRDVSNDNNKYSLIGNSYEVRDDSDLVFPHCKQTIDSDPCYSSQENLRPKAEGSLCRYLNPVQRENSPFKPCIDKDVSRAQKMFDSCVIDYCAYFNMKDKLDKIICQGLEGLADQCQAIGIPIDWRKENICPFACPANSVYKFRASACPKTCLNRAASTTCKKPPVEGCECKDGYLLSDLECVPEIQCGCRTDSNEYIPIDKSIESKDCSSVTTCRNVNGKPTLTKQNLTPCGKNAVCSLVKGHYMCSCKTGFEGDPLRECKDMCSPNPCLNNGVCRVETTGFRCLCTDEFKGDRCERKVPLCTCTASGDPHYKTFDGQMIHFYGACKYTIASYRGVQCTFDVEGKHEYRGGNKAVSYMRLIDFKYKGHVYRLHQGREFYVDGVQRYLPYTNKDGVIVQTTGNKIKLEGPCGVTIEFDGQHSFQLQVPQNIGKDVSGICGTCNNIADDLKTKDGRDVSNDNNKYTLIGNSFEVRDDSDLILPICKPIVDIGNPCFSTKENLKAKAESSLCRYLNPFLSEDSPFKPCIKEDTSRAQKMFDSCVIDYCSYFNMPDKLDKIVCQGIEGFAYQCQRIGIPIDWRKGNICPYSCQANAVYNFRTSACPNTCLDPDASEKCEEPPVEDCECIDGYLLSNLECVPEANCGCKAANGEYIPIGKSIESEDCLSVYTCSNVNGKPIVTKQSRSPCGKNAVCSSVNGRYMCICNTGFEGDPLRECKDKCSPNPCLNKGVCRAEANGFSCMCADEFTGARCERKVPLCTCTASGDPHYKTFDGQMIHFYGACKYTISSYKGVQCTFDVEGKHEYRGGNQAVSYMRLIDFKYKGHVYRLHQGRKFYVDGVLKYLTYTNTDGVIVQITGNNVRLEVPCGVAVEFDGQHSLQLQVPQNIAKNATGICGNCNSIADDMKTKDGRDVSNDNNKYTLIGNSFEVRDDSDLILPSCKPTVDYGNPCYSTKENLQAKAESSLCRYLNPILKEDSPFNPCIIEDTAKAKKMFDSCVIDFCSYFNATDKLDKIICQGLEGFSYQCQKMGIPIDWRKGNICPKVCQANAVYKYRTSACTNTCLDQEASKNCTKLPVEGCECKDGYLLSDVECVPEVECGCKTESGEYIPIEKSIDIDCESVRTCRNVNGKPTLSIESRTPCGKNAVCSPMNGHLTCTCTSGFEGDPLKECKKVPPPSECKTTIIGTEYRGKISVTEQGIPCQRWDSNTPHNPTYILFDQENYCRNPDNSARPWCYTMDKSVRWQFCNIPMCRDCKDTVQGIEYKGKKNVTENGIACQRWDSNTPHTPNYQGQENYCRNPDNSARPWCYTLDKNVRWQYCDIPICKNMS